MSLIHSQGGADSPLNRLTEETAKDQIILDFVSAVWTLGLKFIGGIMV